MKSHKALPSLTFAVSLVLAAATGPTSAWAQQPTSTSQDLLDGIIQDVIGRTIEAASEEVRYNTGIDPLRRGYDPRRSYEPRRSYDPRRSYQPAPADTSEETRRELRQLNAEHDRKIAKLEEELRRKLDKAKTEFRREAAKEGKPEKIAEKRDKLEEKADEAYAKFDEKIDEEYARYDEKRWKILSRERGG